ncbi:peptidylprolyl isomerase [Gilvimarinus japonicus]|uniref:Peptidyl-prolyl cis-trans isomerase n=2 Tax=Gilvimarinus TaxID=940550 RepID=A0ABV7HVF0_9GAMM
MIRRSFKSIALMGALAIALIASGTSLAADKSSEKYVTFETDLGRLVIELYPEKAPVTVANFLAYVDNGFYDGTIFHRVIPGFVVQGGGFTFDFKRKETLPPIVNESDNGLENQYLTLSMARTNAVDSATSQFFINLKHNPSLDASEDKPGYAVFGKVIEGEAVVEKIVAEPRGVFRSYPDAPNAAVRILKSSRGKVKTEASSGSKLKDMIAE